MTPATEEFNGKTGIDRMPGSQFFPRQPVQQDECLRVNAGNGRPKPPPLVRQ